MSIISIGCGLLLHEGPPVRVAKIRIGYVLVDAENNAISDEFGEPYAYASRAEAEAAMPPVSTTEKDDG